MNYKKTINYSYHSQCQGKQKHNAEAKANAHIRSLRKEGEMEAYRCSRCKFWHVGHRKPSQYEVKFAGKK